MVGVFARHVHEAIVPHLPMDLRRAWIHQGQTAGGDLIDRETYETAEGVLNGPEAVEAMTTWQQWIESGYVDIEAVDDLPFQQKDIPMRGPFDTSRASVFDHPSIYAARFVRDRVGQWNLLGFRYDEDETFVGEIADPIPVELTGDQLTEIPAPAPEPP